MILVGHKIAYLGTKLEKKYQKVGRGVYIPRTFHVTFQKPGGKSGVYIPRATFSKPQYLQTLKNAEQCCFVSCLQK